MKIEQALYGENRGGHALRVSSGEVALAQELAPRLDLPDTAPLSAVWSPFVRGFPYRGNYIIARTVLDATAPRAGMVTSHALILRLGDIVTVDNLGPLFDIVSAYVDGSSVATLELDIRPASISYSSFVVATANVLANAGTGPAIWVGNQGFSELVAAIWQNLSPALRENFAFRLSFGPADLVENPPPALVCTPPSLVSRWPHLRVVNTNVDVQPASLAAALLCGDVSGSNLLDFAEKIGARVHSFTELALAEQAYLANGKAKDSFSGQIAVARLIERLSPQASAGVVFKEQLLAKLCRQALTAKPSEILRLRNLQLTAIPNADPFWDSVAMWTEHRLHSESHDPDTITVVHDAFCSDEPAAEWKEAISCSVLKAIAARYQGVVANFWSWANVSSDLALAILQRLPLDVGLETDLAHAAPSQLKIELVNRLLPLCVSSSWLHIHAALLSATRGPHAAVREQIAVDEDMGSRTGLMIALRNATDSEILACALDMSDFRLKALAAEVVAVNPSLLNGTDVGNAALQAIWSDALGLNELAWNAFTDPEAALGRIFDELLLGGNADPSLLDRLSVSPLGDITRYSKRAHVWAVVKGQARVNFLSATASGWLARAPAGGVSVEVEPELRNAILKHPQLTSTFDKLFSCRVDEAVQVIELLDTFDEGRFIRSLKLGIQSRRVMASEAEAIGRLVLARRWSRAAEELVSMYRKQEELRPALRICAPLIPFFTRYFLNLSPPTSAEKWQILEELVNQLYPKGPDENNIWQRAGGSEADLLSHGTGRTRWLAAIGQIRHGGSVRAASLLREISYDFSNNDGIRMLSQDSDFNAW
jgi:hypothetical protein